MTDLPAFDANHYRKTVLAAVEKRGGPDASDPFELYDLPLADDLDDRAVAARVEEVWGFWQRQRDHPKYRVLAALLVETHAARCAELLDAGRRRLAAARVRAQREQRDAGRFELLDAAISRLVARHGEVPRDKLAGLDEVGALAGLTPEEVASRLRRHRVRGPGTAPITADRRRQIRALLDEFGRLTDVPAPPTLLVLLGLTPAASEPQVRASVAAWRSRARELPPQRLRTVVDELLVHIGELLEPGRAAVEAYLDAVAEDVAGYLAPRVRAAVLVEDRLVAEDHAHLRDEAVARGLDERRAGAVLAAIVAELGSTIEGADPEPRRPEPRRPEPRRPESRHAEAHRPEPEPAAAPPPDAPAWVNAARDARGDVVMVLWAPSPASDVTYRVSRLRPDGSWQVLGRVNAASMEDGGAPPGVEAPVYAVMALRDGVRSTETRSDATPEPAGHPAPGPPAQVRATRLPGGSVEVSWVGAGEAEYRVRCASGSRWRVVGRTRTTRMEDGGAPPGEVPVYSVSAVVGGVRSAEARSDAT